WKSRWIEQEPIVTEDGEILAEPVFWFKEDDRVTACFVEGSPGPHTLHTLEDAGIQVVHPGQQISIDTPTPTAPAVVKVISTSPTGSPATLQPPAAGGVTKPGEQSPRYTPAYVTGHWCVTRYAADGKAMSDRRVFPTKGAAEAYAA